MAFPLSPVNGQTTTLNGINYIYNSTSGAWTRIASTSSTTSATAPTNPKIGDTWYDTATDDIYRYTSDGTTSVWLDITGPTVANAQGVNTPLPVFQVGIASNTDATFTTAQLVTFNSKISDTVNAFNTTTNLYVAPMAGYYSINFSLFFTNSGANTQSMQVGIVINGSHVNTPSGDAYGCITIQPNNFTSGTAQVGGQAYYYLNVGDTVGIKPRTNSLRIFQGHSYFGGVYLGTTIGSVSASSGSTTIGYRGLTANQMSTGSVIQVVTTSLNTTFSGAANGTALAVTGLAASITPTSTTSQILIIAQIMYCSLGTTYGGWFTRNGTAINLGAAGSGQQQVSIGMALVTDLNQSNTFVYSNVDSPNTATSTTYQFYVNNDNTGILYINRSSNDTAGSTGKRGVSTVTLMEIAR
jgi:hypothetical protein